MSNAECPRCGHTDDWRAFADGGACPICEVGLDDLVNEGRRADR